MKNDNPTPMEEEVARIAANPGAYRAYMSTEAHDFPPRDDAALERSQRAFAIREIAMNWDIVFAKKLDEWLNENKGEFYHQRGELLQKPGAVTVLLGIDEWRSFSYYRSLCHMIIVDDNCRGELEGMKVNALYRDVGIIRVQLRSYWRFV